MTRAAAALACLVLAALAAGGCGGDGEEAATAAGAPRTDRGVDDAGAAGAARGGGDAVHAGDDADARRAASDALGVGVPEIAHELVELPRIGRLDWRCELPLDRSDAVRFSVGLTVPRDGATVRGEASAGGAAVRTLRADPGERVETPPARARAQRLTLVHRHADETLRARVAVVFALDRPAGDCFVRDLDVQQRAARP